VAPEAYIPDLLSIILPMYLPITEPVQHLATFKVAAKEPSSMHYLLLLTYKADGTGTTKLF